MFGPKWLVIKHSFVLVLHTTLTPAAMVMKIWPYYGILKPKSLWNIMRITFEQGLPGPKVRPRPNPTGRPRADELAQTEGKDKDWLLE